MCQSLFCIEFPRKISFASMKIKILLLLVIAAFSACTASREPLLQNTPVKFTEAHNYFLRQWQSLPQLSKITSSESFGQTFGAATTMGEEGRPTPIDFDRLFALCIVLPATDRETRIILHEISDSSQQLCIKYHVEMGERQSYTMQPLCILLVDKKYERREVILIKN